MKKIQDIKKTKIIATIGPASAKANVVEKMIQNGVDIFRINASHQSEPKEVASLVKLIRSAAKAKSRYVGILLDLQGPKIRVGKFEQEKVKLKNNQAYILTCDDVLGNDKKCSVSYKQLANDIEIGQKVFIDDGRLCLRVENISGKEIFCKVLQGGDISNNKGLNLPDTELSIPALTKKDEKDLELIVENKFDYVALSFVSTAADITLLRKKLEKLDVDDVKIIAKVERHLSVSNIEEIIEVADAVMVARGDLGVEIGFENVPIVQKTIIRKASHYGKPVIVATQMLESMVHSKTATRAEVSDVANAIFDRCDAVMLSGESAVGVDPVQVVETTTQICLAADHYMEDRKKGYRFIKNYFEDSNSASSLCIAADQISEEIGAKAIMALSRSGRTALIASKLNSVAPVIAPTDSIETCQRMALYRGVIPVLVPKKFSQIHRWRDMIKLALEQAKQYVLLKPTDEIVAIAEIPIERGIGPNSIRIIKVSLQTN
jgi:pyruvate kinase